MALMMETSSEPKTNDEIVDLEAISALKESAAIELKVTLMIMASCFHMFYVPF